MRKIGLLISLFPLLSVVLGYGIVGFLGGDVTTRTTSSPHVVFLVEVLFALPSIVWIINSCYAVWAMWQVRKTDKQWVYYLIWLLVSLYLLISKDITMSSHSLYLLPCYAAVWLTYYFKSS